MQYILRSLKFFFNPPKLKTMSLYPNYSTNTIFEYPDERNIIKNWKY